MNKQSRIILFLLLLLPCAAKAALLLGDDINKAKSAARTLTNIITKLSDTTKPNAWESGVRNLSNLEAIVSYGTCNHEIELGDNLAYRFRIRQHGLTFYLDTGFKDKQHGYHNDISVNDVIARLRVLKNTDSGTFESSMDALKNFAEGMKETVEANLKTVESVQKGANFITDRVKNRLEHNERIGFLRDENKEANRALRQKWANFGRIFLTPQYVALGVAGIGGAYGLSKLLGRSSEIAMNMFEKYLNKPDLITETSRPGNFVEWIKHQLGMVEVDDRSDEFVAPPGIAEDLADLLAETACAYEHELPLTNVLFYGPPGTGKTMLAKNMAKNSGLDYAIFSGASFSKFGDDIDIAIQELEKVIKWGETSPKGLIIFVDEAECFLQQRDFPDTEGLSAKLTNEFLSKVEKPSNNKIMWIFATNHRGVLDDAVESRIGKSFEFKLPDFAGRQSILMKYVNKYLVADGIQIDAELENNITPLIQALDGMSGRSIEDIVVKLHRQAVMNNRVLTYDRVCKTIATSVKDLIDRKEARAKYVKARYNKVDAATMDMSNSRRVAAAAAA